MLEQGTHSTLIEAADGMILSPGPVRDPQVWAAGYEAGVLITQAPALFLLSLGFGTLLAFSATRFAYRRRRQAVGETRAQWRVQLESVSAPASQLPEDPDAITQDGMIVGRAIGVTLLTFEGKAKISRLEAREAFRPESIFWWRRQVMTVEGFADMEADENGCRLFHLITCCHHG